MSLFATGMTGGPLAVMASAQSFAASQCLSYFVSEGALPDENPPQWAWQQLSKDGLDFLEQDPDPIALRAQIQFFDATARNWFPSHESPLYDEIPSIIRRVLESVPGSLSYNLVTNLFRENLRDFLAAGAQELFSGASSLDQLRQLEEAHAAALIEQDFTERVRALSDVATRFVKLGDPRRAVAIYEQAAKVAERMSDPEQRELASRLIQKSISESSLNRTTVVKRFTPPAIPVGNPFPLPKLWDEYAAMQLELDRTGEARGLLPLMHKAAEGAFYEGAGTFFVALIPRIHPSHYPEMRLIGLDVAAALEEIGEHLSRMASNHDMSELGPEIMSIVQDFNFLPFGSGEVTPQHLSAKALISIADKLQEAEMIGLPLELYVEALMQALVSGEAPLSDIAEHMAQRGWDAEVVIHFQRAAEIDDLAELVEHLIGWSQYLRPEAIYNAAFTMIRYIDDLQRRSDAIRALVEALAQSDLGTELYFLYRRAIAFSFANPDLLKLISTAVADAKPGEAGIPLFEELVEAVGMLPEKFRNDVWGQITRDLDRIGMRAEVEVPRSGALGLLSRLERYRRSWVAGED